MIEIICFKLAMLCLALADFFLFYQMDFLAKICISFGDWLRDFFVTPEELEEIKNKLRDIDNGI